MRNSEFGIWNSCWRANPYLTIPQVVWNQIRMLLKRGYASAVSLAAVSGFIVFSVSASARAGRYS